MAPKGDHEIVDGSPVSNLSRYDRTKRRAKSHACTFTSLQSEWKMYSEYHINVDPDQDDKATEIKLCSFARPHMRAFHCSWWSVSVLRRLHVHVDDASLETVHETVCETVESY